MVILMSFISYLITMPVRPSKVISGIAAFIASHIADISISGVIPAFSPAAYVQKLYASKAFASPFIFLILRRFNDII